MVVIYKNIEEVKMAMVNKYYSNLKGKGQLKKSIIDIARPSNLRRLENRRRTLVNPVAKDKLIVIKVVQLCHRSNQYNAVYEEVIPVHESL